MRDLARSIIRFSWAMSVLGARQAANLVTPRRGWDRSAETFDAVSHAATKEMGETMKSLYQAGDRLQGGLVDSVSRLFSGTWSDPGKALNEAWESIDRLRSGNNEGRSQPSGKEE